MSTELEPALADLEARMDEAERLAKSALVRLKKARRMAAIGDINGIVAQL